jgi:hypothetical protein
MLSERWSEQCSPLRQALASVPNGSRLADSHGADSFSSLTLSRERRSVSPDVLGRERHALSPEGRLSPAQRGSVTRHIHSVSPDGRGRLSPVGHVSPSRERRGTSPDGRGRLSPVQAHTPILSSPKTSVRAYREKHHVTWADSDDLDPTQHSSPRQDDLASKHAVSKLTSDWVLNVTITGASPQSSPSGRSNAYAAYAIQVEIYIGSTVQPRASYTLSKRYSRFFEMHNQLSKDFPESLLPSLPKRKMMQGSVNPSLVAERTESLQQYLRDLMNHPELRSSEPVYSFLELNSVAQLMCSTWAR